MVVSSFYAVDFLVVKMSNVYIYYPNNNNDDDDKQQNN